MRSSVVTVLWFVVLALLGGVQQVLAQAEVLYPAGTFASPVDHPIRTSGTFGELRSDHFHMGLDVKSERGVEGDDLYAVDAGYISRLRISSAGYGNAVYIDHPRTGLRSLYAHLQDFSPRLRRYVDSVSYARESFELELELAPYELPVERRERIGKMGNTGSSFGAHLHFELRHMVDDAAINPLLYDFPVSDTRAPEMRALSVYLRGAAREVPLSLKQVTRLSGNSPTYTIRDTVRVPAGEIGFGVETIDRQNGTSNRNGVYRLTSRCEGEVHWQATYDTVAFEDTRYIQAHYDFAAHMGGDGYLYRLHRLAGDRQPHLYDVLPNDGYIRLGFGESCDMEITASDPFGNEATLRFVVKADQPAPPVEPKAYNYVLKPTTSELLVLGDATLLVPAGAVYVDTYVATSVSDDVAAGALSRRYCAGNPLEPLQKDLTLNVPLQSVPVGLRAKTYLAGITPESALTGSLTTGSTHLVVPLESWGSYELRVDTTAPRIVPLDRYTYTLTDKVTRARNLRYRVTQNGQWVLATFDAKRDRLEVRRDRLGKGSITVEVWDAAGNRGVVER